MYQHQPNTPHIQSRLFDLQRGYPMVEGLLLVSYGGLTLASTFQKEESVSRLAAVSRTMFLLAADACNDMERGEMLSLHLSYKRGRGGDDNTPSQVIMRSVGEATMLVMVLHSPLGMIADHDLLFMNDVERMVGYIAHMITFAP